MLNVVVALSSETLKYKEFDRHRESIDGLLSKKGLEVNWVVLEGEETPTTVYNALRSHSPHMLMLDLNYCREGKFSNNIPAHNIVAQADANRLCKSIAVVTTRNIKREDQLAFSDLYGILGPAELKGTFFYLIASELERVK